MTDNRLDVVLDLFEKAADSEDESVTEESFQKWIEAQEDSDEIYDFFGAYVDGLIADTKAQAEKEEIETARLQLIDQNKVV